VNCRRSDHSLRDFASPSWGIFCRRANFDFCLASEYLPPSDVLNNAQLRSVVSAAYTAATDSSAWDACLTQFAHVLRSVTTGLHHYNADRTGGAISRFVNLDPEWLKDYDAHYAARNAFMIHGAHLLHSGVTLTDHELCPADILKRTDWYNDYLLPHRIEKNIGVCLFREPTVLSNLTVMRHERSFTDGELRFVRSVVPHFQQAIRVRRRLQDVTLPEMWSADLLARVPAGVYLLGPDGRILHMNEAARAQVALNDGLSCNAGTLRAATVVLSQALARAISSAVAIAPAASDDRGTPPAVVRLLRPSEQPAWSAVAIPLTRRPSDVPGPVHALLVVSDPARRAALNATALQALFGLTRGEVRVLESLLSGESVSSAADRLCIAADTARTHVKHLLRKTGAKRQSELIARLTPPSVQTVIGDACG
jgi:DNA-binding CsgD family transcriptional regulator